MGRQHFDLVVIGSGSGNTIVDERFDSWEVAIVDKGTGPGRAYGGTCLNVGCIPSKMLAYTAEVASSPAEAARLGVELSLDSVRWHDIRERVFGRIDAIAEAGRRYRAQAENIVLFDGVAAFTGKKELKVDLADRTETINADQVVVAAGSRPKVPFLEGLAESGYHTSDTIMRLDCLPERLLVLGTGFVASELANVFSSLGSQVAVVGRSERFLRWEDVAVSERFTEIARERWDVRLRRHVTAVEGKDGDLRLRLDDGEVLEGDCLLLALGRVPNSDLVAAQAGGLAVDVEGFIEVDATQATSVEGVWALGDVSSPYMLKHVANHEARVVQHNLLHPHSLVEADHRFVPQAVFSSPQIASVGLTSQEAEARRIEHVSALQPYAGVAYGWAMEDTTGFVKLLAEPSGRLLGAHIIGSQAPTLIQPLVQAMHFGLDARSMARGQYWIHPAMTEVVENALLALPLGRGGHKGRC